MAKKIMFNDKYSLTQAVLDGRKTMTRRIIKCPETYKGRPVKGLRITGSKDIRLAVEMLVYNEECDDFVPMYIQPRYEIGEVIAVAQSYESLGMNPEIALDDKDGIGFYTKTKFAPGWKNKMFVRADLMPHHIRITNIKIERLQDISDKDCLKEGIYKGQCGSADTHFMDAYYYKGDIQPYCTPREAFAALIDKVSGKGTWESNPYVFVYEFELFN
nr:MAG TPA: ASCH domain protein [Bacteriophage sp.]